METFLRLIYLKYRYRVGFESLCREVAESVRWSRFCRVPLGGSVPDHSTLKNANLRAQGDRGAELGAAGEGRQ
jgi:IS5 family transposase